MMTGYLLTAQGDRLNLPPFLSWRLRRTGSVPCDSFEAECPWDAGAEPAFENACRVIAEEEGTRRFTGVLDEYRLTWDDRGGVISLSGRGLAALLLDNESLGQDYQVATLADILRDHVEPYGIPLGSMGSLPPVPGFSVSTGQSEWQTLYNFARYHGGVQPRFDVFGALSVDGGETGRTVTVDDRTGVTSLSLRDKRYGVRSEIVVLDRGSREPRRVRNDGFLAQGGSCRRVMTMPAKSAYEAMRYSGQFQLDRSAEERFRLEFTVPGSCFCEPGDRVSLCLTHPAIAGTWLVEETEASMDSGGTRTKVTLR